MTMPEQETLYRRASETETIRREVLNHGPAYQTAELKRAEQNMKKLQARLVMVGKVAESMEKGTDRELLLALANGPEAPKSCPDVRTRLDHGVFKKSVCGYPMRRVNYPGNEPDRSMWECPNCGYSEEAM